MLFHVLRFLHWLGFRFYKVYYDEYRMPLICRFGYHDPVTCVNGFGICKKCHLQVPLLHMMMKDISLPSAKGEVASEILPSDLECPHEKTSAVVDVTKLIPSGTFMADIRIRCIQCGVDFAFVGLPMGLKIGGAAVSPDKLEARLTITPVE